MKINRKRVAAYSNVAVPAGLLLILLATLVPFFLRNREWAVDTYKYVYAAGALVLLSARLFSPSADTDMRLRRLRRIESWSAIFFCVASFFLFYPGAELRDWLAFTLAGAAIQIFTSVAIPNRQAKLAKTAENDKH